MKKQVVTNNTGSKSKVKDDAIFSSDAQKINIDENANLSNSNTDLKEKDPLDKEFKNKTLKRYASLFFQNKIV